MGPFVEKKMQRAQHNALLQATNQGLLNIRQAELNYYSSFYSTFGGQAALIGGFAYGSLTQISFPQTTTYQQYVYIQDIFWCSTSICMAAAMHCIITTIFIQVLGPGMALHGPIGSMAKAAIGMRSEMNETFLSYLTMVFFFALSTLMSFWVLMGVKGASISTVLFVLGGTQWWRYCFRIYNRFYIDPIAVGFDDTGDEISDRGSVVVNPMGKQAQPQKRSGAQTTASGSANGSNANNNNNNSPAPPVPPEVFAMQGYLTKKDGKKEGSKESWSRRYFVLTSHGELYYYRTKKLYEDYPKQPIKDRPIDLGLYTVLDTSRPANNEFEITLKYKDEDDTSGRMWRFRCDTADELEMWQRSLRAASDSQS